jgi:hypothetical protein
MFVAQTSSSCTEVTEEQVQAAVSRVLCVTWKEQNESSIYLPETASAVNDMVQQRNSIEIQVIVLFHVSLWGDIDV